MNISKKHLYLLILTIFALQAPTFPFNLRNSGLVKTTCDTITIKTVADFDFTKTAYSYGKSLVPVLSATTLLSFLTEEYIEPFFKKRILVQFDGSSLCIKGIDFRTEDICGITLTRLRSSHVITKISFTTENHTVDLTPHNLPVSLEHFLYLLNTTINKSYREKNIEYTIIETQGMLDKKGKTVMEGKASLQNVFQNFMNATPETRKSAFVYHKGGHYYLFSKPKTLYAFLLLGMTLCSALFALIFVNQYFKHTAMLKHIPKLPKTNLLTLQRTGLTIHLQYGTRIFPWRTIKTFMDNAEKNSKHQLSCSEDITIKDKKVSLPWKTFIGLLRTITTKLNNINTISEDEFRTIVANFKGQHNL